MSNIITAHFPWLPVDALQGLEECPNTTIWCGPLTSTDHTFYCSAFVATSNEAEFKKVADHNSHIYMEPMT